MQTRGIEPLAVQQYDAFDAPAVAPLLFLRDKTNPCLISIAGNRSEEARTQARRAAQTATPPLWDGEDRARIF
ncbi:MAG: hypothetical protein H6715_00840 [Myxococcales bacterium]|nr:hypothetical protein [Myxococcales bacterium]